MHRFRDRTSGTCPGRQRIAVSLFLDAEVIERTDQVLPKNDGIHGDGPRSHWLNGCTIDNARKAETHTHALTPATTQMLRCDRMDPSTVSSSCCPSVTCESKSVLMRQYVRTPMQSLKSNQVVVQHADRRVHACASHGRPLWAVVRAAGRRLRTGVTAGCMPTRVAPLLHRGCTNAGQACTPAGR